MYHFPKKSIALWHAGIMMGVDASSHVSRLQVSRHGCAIPDNRKGMLHVPMGGGVWLAL